MFNLSDPSAVGSSQVSHSVTSVSLSGEEVKFPFSYTNVHLNKVSLVFRHCCFWCFVYIYIILNIYIYNIEYMYFTYIFIYTYIHTYICACVCECVYRYIYMYIYVYKRKNA